MSAEPRPNITCPICGRTSWHPRDVEEGWCGACHGATGRPLPEGAGLRWVMMRGGSIDAGRLLEEPLPDRYEVMASGEVYVQAGEQYVLASVDVQLDPRFEQHRQIEPGSCPGGVVMHLVDARGRLLHERKLGSLEDADLWAGVDAEQALEQPGTVYLYGYDGDTGECMGTVIGEPEP